MSDSDIAALILSEHDVFRRDFAALEQLEGDALQEAIAPIEAEMAADTALPPAPVTPRPPTRGSRAAKARV